MDCSPEYVVGYYSECEKEKNNVAKDGGDEKCKQVKDVVCQQQKQMEKILFEEEATTTTNFSSYFPSINQLKMKHTELKHLFNAKKRWERRLKGQTKAEQEYEKVLEDRRENIVPLLIKETEQREERNNELKKHIQSVKFDICEELKATDSKINSVQILTGLYEQHKVRIMLCLEIFLYKDFSSLFQSSLVQNYFLEILNEEGFLMCKSTFYRL